MLLVNKHATTLKIRFRLTGLIAGLAIHAGRNLESIWCLPCLQITPFLLESIRNKTGGKSLAANIQLVKNNAAVGSQIAVALSALG